jgi:hypothetical protein
VQPQTQALTDGFHYAFEIATRNEDCASFFAKDNAGAETGPDAYGQIYVSVANALAATTYRILPLQGGRTGAQTADSTDVFINSKGAFFTAQAAANGSVTVGLPSAINGRLQSITFASLQVFRGFLLLHELGHQVGDYGADTSPVINGRNSQAILDHCFQQNAQGVWSGASMNF